MRTAEHRRAFVDHVKRIGHENGGVRRARIDHRLRERIDRFFGADDRQQLRFWIELWQVVARLHPIGDGAAEFERAFGGWILREASGVLRERIANKLRGWVLRLTNREIDGFQVLRRLHGGEQAS